MKIPYKFTPLFLLAPLGYYFGPYLGGAGCFSEGVGFLISAISMFVVPFMVAAIFFFLHKTKWYFRIPVFMTVIILQFGLIFLGPAAATSETMGLAHRMKRDYSIAQIQECANQIRQKRRDGTLKLKDQIPGPTSYLLNNRAVVDESELLPSLQGRFEVVLVSGKTNPDKDEVIFLVHGMEGLLCDPKPIQNSYTVYFVAPGIYAFRWERQ